MVKVTLFDECCVSFVSGTACFFVDELEEFETPWLAQTTDAETINRFQRSKNGEFVADYYANDPSLNIIQVDQDTKILYESKHVLSDCHISVLNTYNCASSIYVKQAEIYLRYILFQGVYHLVGRYTLHGVCKESVMSTEACKVYKKLSLWGNKVFLSDFQSQPLTVTTSNEQRKALSFKEAYANDHVETFCWIDLTLEQTKELTKEMFDTILTDTLLSDLMRDIVGEAG